MQELDKSQVREREIAGIRTAEIDIMSPLCYHLATREVPHLRCK